MPSATQQPLPLLAVALQVSMRKYCVLSVPVNRNTREYVYAAPALILATDRASPMLCASPFKRAFFCIRCQDGMAIAATIANTAITISTSSNENPASAFFDWFLRKIGFISRPFEALFRAPSYVHNRVHGPMSR